MTLRKTQSGATRRDGPEQSSGFGYFILGLATGIIATLLLSPPSVEQTTTPEYVETTIPKKNEPATPITFEFYQMLSERQVQPIAVAEENQSELADNNNAVTEEPAETLLKETDSGSNLILQTGSFSTLPAADKARAELALIGIDAKIQRVVVNGQNVHYRVRIGPFKTRKEFDETRKQLTSNQREHLVLRLEAFTGHAVDGNKE